MTTEIATFTCSICGEPSTEICVYCTKDSCRNHRCERCKRCSDCCECEIPLSAEEPEIVVVEHAVAVPVVEAPVEAAASEEVSHSEEPPLVEPQPETPSEF